MSRKWHGTYVKRARKYIAAQLPAPCWRCGRMLHIQDAWVVGHLIEADRAPWLEHNPSNWAVECRPCSDRSGAVYSNQKRARQRLTPTSRDW